MADEPYEMPYPTMLGYNMPGQQQPARPGQPGGPPPPPPPMQQQGPTSFRDRLNAGVQAWGTEHMARNPNMPFGDTTSSQVKAGLHAFDPTGKALTAWAATKWAFRGNRTTNALSPATEQNLYGGVGRNEIPTSRISTWKPSAGTPGPYQPAQRRAMMNEQELAWTGATPPPGGEQVGAGGAPMGLPPGTGADPMTMSSMSERFVDPLFEKNIAHSPVNAAQFGNLHQRQVSGGG